MDNTVALGETHEACPKVDSSDVEKSSDLKAESDENNVELEQSLENVKIDGSNNSEDGPVTELDEIDGMVVKATCTQNLKQVSPLEKIAPDGKLRRKQTCLKDTDDTVDKVNEKEETSSKAESVTNVIADKRKEAILEINGDVDFCKIVTVRYKFENKKTKQHYIQEGKGEVDGNIGLEPLDELIEVNGYELTNKSQSKVKKIFRHIRLDEEKSELHLDLKVRRWQRAPDSPEDDPVWTKVLEIEFKLILVPEEQLAKPSEARSMARRVVSQIQRKRRKRLGRRLSVRKFEEKINNKTNLPVGNIEVQGTNPPSSCHVEVNEAHQFLHTNSDGLLSCRELHSMDSGLFKAEPFFGVDTGPQPFSLHVFGLRLYAESNGLKLFLCYDPNDLDVYCKHHEDDVIETEAIDERCFIDRMLGNQRLFQSALDRDLFIFYDQDNKRFKMKNIGSKYLVSLQDRDQDSYGRFRGCWFQIIDNMESDEEPAQTSFWTFLTCGPFRSRSSMSVRNRSKWNRRPAHFT